MSTYQFDCECCGTYCGNSRRLQVRVPLELEKKILKKRPYLLGQIKYWLCDDCVRKHCKETIGGYWFEKYFPRSESDDL